MLLLFCRFARGIDSLRPHVDCFSQRRSFMSISSSIGRGLVALGVLAAVSSTAHADRRTGMAGNLLVEDKDDVFLFPHLTSTYRNLISLDYGGTETSGNALLTLGNADMAYGVALHRGDVLNPYGIDRARNSEIL